MKHAAFIRLFLICIIAPALFSLGGCDSSPKAKMERVLRQHQAFREEIQRSAPQNASDEALDTYASVIWAGVQKQKGLNLSGCPPEFISTYGKHLQAWEQLSEAIRNHPEIPSTMEAVIGGFLRGLQGDITGGGLEVLGKYWGWWMEARSAEKKINRTWGDIENICRLHNVTMP